MIKLFLFLILIFFVIPGFLVWRFRIYEQPEQLFVEEIYLATENITLPEGALTTENISWLRGEGIWISENITSATETTRWQYNGIIRFDVTDNSITITLEDYEKDTNPKEIEEGRRTK